RERDTVLVPQFRLDLGGRPVPRTAAMTDPAKDIPADGPFGQSDGDFEFRALGRGVAGAGEIGTVVELADQFHRPLQGVEVAVAVVTDRHHPPARRAIPLEDIEFPSREIRILGPGVRHPATSVLLRDPLMRSTRQELTPATAGLLALLRTVEKNRARSLT